MDSQYLQAGQIVNTHGIRGEVRIMPWCDGPEFLLDFPVLYIDGQAIEVLSARVHKSFVLAQLRGVDSVEAAVRLKSRIVCIARADVHLPPGRFFVADLIGLRAVDPVSGETIGTLTDVESKPAHDVYTITEDDGAVHLVPNVPAFVGSIDLTSKTVEISLIEGM